MVIRGVSEIIHPCSNLPLRGEPPSQMTSLQPRCVASSGQQFSKASRKFRKLFNCTDTDRREMYAGPCYSRENGA